MRILITLLAALCLLTACAENPLGLAPGMWVRHKIDGQKYFVTDVRTDVNPERGGLVKVKNELGVEVEKDFTIPEFELWIERKQIPDGVESNLERELRRARLALEAANTPESRDNLERQIEQAEELSPVFRKKTWNPETSRYE